MDMSWIDYSEGMMTERKVEQSDSKQVDLMDMQMDDTEAERSVSEMVEP